MSVPLLAAITAAAVVAALALSSGVPGVLYAATTSGKVFAVIVDSPGLDPAAPWPRYQHDARNTGNPATPITNCP